MSGKQTRKIRREYHRAAAYYWTKDMEREIQKIHAARKMWRAISIGQLAIIAGVVLWLILM